MSDSSTKTLRLFVKRFRRQIGATTDPAVTTKSAAANKVIDIAEDAREEAGGNVTRFEVVETVEEDRTGCVDREQVEHFEVADFGTDLDVVAVCRIDVDLETGLVDLRVELDQIGLRWAHNEDAMATEKLAEGIRAFAADQLKLEQLVASRLGLAV